MFEQRLTDNISKLNFTKMLDPKNVRRVIDEADGYQPHLVAPEMGYRRLVQECLTLLKVDAMLVNGHDHHHNTVLLATGSIGHCGG